MLAYFDACAALVSHSTQCPTSFAQVGAIEALTGSQKFVQDLVAEYRRRRDFLHAALVAIPKVTCVQPAGAFYLFPNVARYLGDSSEEAKRAFSRLWAALRPELLGREAQEPRIWRT